MLENSVTSIKESELVRANGQTGQLTTVTGQKMCAMEMEHSSQARESNMKASGKTI